MGEYDVGVSVDIRVFGGWTVFCSLIKVLFHLVIWFASLMEVWWLVGQEVDHMETWTKKMTRFFHVEDLEKQRAAMFGFWSLEFGDQCEILKRKHGDMPQNQTTIWRHTPLSGTAANPEFTSWKMNILNPKMQVDGRWFPFPLGYF